MTKWPGLCRISNFGNTALPDYVGHAGHACNARKPGTRLSEVVDVSIVLQR
jgi:hypothetical protein